MIKVSTIRIEAVTNTWGTRIFVDDKEINNVTAVSFFHRVGHMPSLSVEMFSSANGQVQVKDDQLQKEIINMEIGI